MAWLRDIDRWLVERVLPFAVDYRRSALRLVGPDDAEDIVQAAYARLIAYPAWRDVADARALCLRTVRNLAIDRLRSADIVQIDRFAEIDGLELPDDQPDAYRQVAGRIELERLLRIVDRLPPQCARVVRLRKIDGRSPHEIAVLLGLSVSTIEKHLAKGVAAVVEGMRSEEIAVKGAQRPWLRPRRRG